MTCTSKSRNFTIAYANVSGMSAIGTTPQRRKRSSRKSDGKKTAKTTKGTIPATVPRSRTRIGRRAARSGLVHHVCASARSPRIR